MNREYIIYDSDERYARKLMDVLSDSDNHRTGVRMFTAEKSLVSYLDCNTPDAILISEDCYTYEIGERYDGKLLMLMDEKSISDDRMKQYGSNVRCIYKYQSSRDIINEIVGNEDGYTNFLKKELEIIGVFSMEATIGKSLFALSMCRELADKGSVLYMNLEQFSGLKSILNQSVAGDKTISTLSDALYCCMGMDDVKSVNEEKVIPAAAKGEYFEFYGPAECSDDILNLDFNVFLKLLGSLERKDTYRYIVLDLQCGTLEQLSIMQRCNKIYVPGKSDTITKSRDNDMELYLLSRDMEWLVDRIRKVDITSVGDNLSIDNWTEDRNGGIRDIVNSVIGL